MSIYDIIMSSFDENCVGIFFLYRYGGTGKSSTKRAISTSIRSNRDIDLSVTSNEISSLLIPDGKTTHSRSAIPISIIEKSMRHIKSDEPLTELIIKSKVII